MKAKRKQRSKILLLCLALLAFLLIVSAILLNNRPENNQNNLSNSNSSSQTSTISSDSSTAQSSSKIDKSDWKLQLVNEENPLPEGFNIETKALKGSDYPINGKEVDARIYDSLIKMMDDAKKSGNNLLVCSGYRNYQYQVDLFNQEKKKYTKDGKSEQEAYAMAKTAVAIPGTSEHNMGLAVDIVAVNHQTLDNALMDTPEIKWLYANCHKYGFIVRYPEGKSEITKIIHEPWHYRYVGVEAATEIMQSGLTLEEYLQQN